MLTPIMRLILYLLTSSIPEGEKKNNMQANRVKLEPSRAQIQAPVNPNGTLNGRTAKGSMYLNLKKAMNKKE